MLRPRSISIIGGREEARYLIENCTKVGFEGPVWHVHSKRGDYARLSDLPRPPDAAFICVNRKATIEVTRELSAMGGGGAVAYAAGFREAEEQLADGASLERELLVAAGDMPLIGPNCYGFINYLDGAALWPDQQGGRRAERGVAILTQSSNIAINLTMQQRGLPVAYVVTSGNQAQLGVADLAKALIADPRVTALGLHLEGVGELGAFEEMAEAARNAGTPIVALKVGKSSQAQSAAITHTASLSGNAAGASALFRRLRIAEAPSLSAFLEALSVLHVTGPLASNRIASLSCSGGEAGLMADTLAGHGLTCPPLTEVQRSGLKAALGPKVALSNPLDYNTYIWNDVDRMAATYTAMMRADLALGIVVADFPRGDRCSAADWEAVIEATRRAQMASGKPMAILATLPETLPEAIAERLIALGILPLSGIEDGVAGLAACVLKKGQGRAQPNLFVPAIRPGDAHALTEAEAKSELAAFGVDCPLAERHTRDTLAGAIVPFPVVLKGEGIAHKTEAGAVALHLTRPDEVMEAADRMPTDRFLLEEMVTGGIAELLIGVTRDAAHGFLLTLGAGGTLTELLADTAHLLLPARSDDIRDALASFRISKILEGYRGAPAANVDAILDTVQAVTDYVAANRDRLDELEINPLIVTETRAVAADVLIRRCDA